MMNTEHTMEQAFRLGWEEADGEVGTTYDDDPTSPRSEAYDCGRTVGRLPEPWKSTLAAAPAMLAALKAVHAYFNQTRSGREWRDNGGSEPQVVRDAITQAEGDRIARLRDLTGNASFWRSARQERDKELQKTSFPKGEDIREGTKEDEKTCL